MIEKMDFKKLLTPKTIFLILGLIVVVEVIFAVRTLRQPTPSDSKPIQQMRGGKIILVSPKKQYRVGESIPVRVTVSTGGYLTDGTDLILKFDPQVLEATGAGALNKGKIYSEYPVVQAINSDGLIRISGIAGVNEKGFTGNGLFATLNLRAKKAGQTSLTVDFGPGQTHESNIVQSKTTNDILEKVYNLDLTIQ